MLVGVNKAEWVLLETVSPLKLNINLFFLIISEMFLYAT